MQVVDFQPEQWFHQFHVSTSVNIRHDNQYFFRCLVVPSNVALPKTMDVLRSLFARNITLIKRDATNVGYDI